MTDPTWRKLDARVLALHGVRLAGAVAPIALLLLLGGSLDRTVTITLAFIFGGAALSAANDALRWATTRYRVDDERVELRSGLLRRSALSVPRDRVRTVNLTAKPLHRAFRIATVEIGTGSREQGRLKLDAVAAGEAARLRTALLERTQLERAEAPADETLAQLRWGWLPYHLLSPWTLALPIVGLGALFNTLEQFGIQGRVDRIVKDVAIDGGHSADALPAWLLVVVIALGVLAFLVVGAIGASAQFVESWWGFRLTREPGDGLHVRRGLLTSRSLTIEHRRLRGIEIAEPLLVRAVPGASVRALVSGLHAGGDRRAGRADALLPNVPRAEADRVVADVLREPAVPRQLRELRSHPQAALRRRLLRALALAALPVVVLLLLGPVAQLVASWIWIAALSLVAPALWLGRDAYRSLGHGIGGRYLMTRHGTFDRRTAALRRDGVIGWTVRRSLFQRRAGLVTLTATTAAGRGGYSVIDVGESAGLAFAEHALPGILTPFVEREAHGGAEP